MRSTSARAELRTAMDMMRQRTGSARRRRSIHGRSCDVGAAGWCVTSIGGSAEAGASSAGFADALDKRLHPWTAQELLDHGPDRRLAGPLADELVHEPQGLHGRVVGCLRVGGPERARER